MIERRRHWDERYLSGPTPWDTGITPPEVVAFWHSQRLPAQGPAIDLGCGSGANVAYLVERGLRVIGVELSGIGLAKARMRLTERLGELVTRAALLQGDAARLPLRNAGASYILDIGCLHSLPLAQRELYARSVIDNLHDGGFYHLFAFDRVQVESGSARAEQGMGEDEVSRLFSPGLSLLSVERGQPDQRPCRWYLLQKPLP